MRRWQGPWSTPFKLECPPFRLDNMAEVVEERRSGPKSVKDVPADEFIKAFSAYLKKTGKVGVAKRLDILGD